MFGGPSDKSIKKTTVLLYVPVLAIREHNNGSTPHQNILKLQRSLKCLVPFESSAEYASAAVIIYA